MIVGKERERKGRKGTSERKENNGEEEDKS